MNERGETCLGVERSHGGRRWVIRAGDNRESDQRTGLAIAQRLGVPEIVGRLLAARGVDAESAASFLNPALRDHLPDPSRFKDMDRAVERLVRAVGNGEGIAVFGDYDVDGATSAALLHRFFAAIGVAVTLYVPDRLTEGYGPNAPALRRLRDAGIAVVVTVDCGITAFEALAEAEGVGLDVIVIDHHVAEPRLPPAHAVVDPNRLDEADDVRAGYGTLAAVGLAFLLVVGVNRSLRRAGRYESSPEPDLLQWLDLVALGTICDVVPLRGLNRAFAAQGLKVMAARANIGLAALADRARIAERPTGWHAGFVLGPRVNAGGRIGAADLGARLLSTEDPAEAAAIADRLEALNAERRAIERVVLDAAQVKAEAASHPAFIFVSGEDWHPGVIGVVASRLKERFGRPACVVALVQDKAMGMIGKGSGRSVAGVDFGSAVIAARQAGLLINGGGHPMAAGLTVAADRIEDLRDFLTERLAGQMGVGSRERIFELDGVLALAAVTPDLARVVADLGPFGSGNAEPRFAITGVRVVRATQAGAEHVRCILAGAGGGRLKAIAFRAFESDVGRALMRSSGAVMHLAGCLRLDRWQGREEVQLVIEDAAAA